MAAEESYPEDLKYHPEHDWARIEGDVATFGITWYAQDSLGEVVFYEPPDVGSSVSKDQPYTEVESVKAVSDVYAPLSGEVVEVNEKLADSPEMVNEDPYGDGWLAKVKLSDPSEADHCSTPPPIASCWPASGPTSGHSTTGWTIGRPTRPSRARLRPHYDQRGDPLHVRNRRRPGSDARGDRGLVDRRVVRSDPRGAAAHRCPGARGRPLGVRMLRRACQPRGPQRPRRRRGLLPWRGHVRPLRAGPGRRDHSAFGVPHPLHAVPARGLAGRAAGDVRVPDGDLGADRASGRQRLPVRGAVVGRVGCLSGDRGDQAQAARRLAWTAPAQPRRAANVRQGVRGGGRGGGPGRRRHRR